jgi:hypothetical protein
MSEKYIEFELKKDGTTEKVKFNNYILIGIDQNEVEKTHVARILTKISGPFNTKIFHNELTKLKERLGEKLEKRPYINKIFNMTNEIIDIFEKEGIQGLKYERKNGKFSEFKNTEFENILKILEEQFREGANHE